MDKLYIEVNHLTKERKLIGANKLRINNDNFTIDDLYNLLIKTQNIANEALNKVNALKSVYDLQAKQNAIEVANLKNTIIELGGKL